MKQNPTFLPLHSVFLYMFKAISYFPAVHQLIHIDYCQTCETYIHNVTCINYNYIIIFVLSVTSKLFHDIFIGYSINHLKLIHSIK